MYVGKDKPPLCVEHEQALDHVAQGYIELALLLLANAPRLPIHFVLTSAIGRLNDQPYQCDDNDASNTTPRE
jgi:hypothetical protein